MGNFRSDNRPGGYIRDVSRDRGRNRDRDDSSGKSKKYGKSRAFGGGINRRDQDDRSGGDREGFRGRRDSGMRGERRRLELHDVTCAKCGKETQVPFKPTGDKPVYCRECFDKGNSGSSQNSGGISQEQFKQLNAKLDKILDFLNKIEFEDEGEEYEDDNSEELEAELPEDEEDQDQEKSSDEIEEEQQEKDSEDN